MARGRLDILLFLLMNGMDRIRARRGLLARIARSLGVAPSTVSMWQQVPSGRLVAVEQITGIERHLLRPDLYRPSGRARHDERGTG
jgi:DNA-binding transcriptional regulator YdaS (Cro superfamily)